MNTRVQSRAQARTQSNFVERFGAAPWLLPSLPAPVLQAISTLGGLGWLSLESVVIAHRLWCRANPEQAKVLAASTVPAQAHALPTPTAVDLSTLDAAWLAMVCCAMALEAPSHGNVAHWLGGGPEPPDADACEVWPEAEVIWPAAARVHPALRESGMVSEDSVGTSPFVLELDSAVLTSSNPALATHGALYARRYLRAELEVASRLSRRAGRAAQMAVPDEQTCQRAVVLTTWTADDGLPGTPNVQQALAAASAVGLSFFALVGGPGTGKTSTLRAALTMQALTCLAEGRVLPQVALAAPTGKAAARMLEALNKDLEQFERQMRRAGISTEQQLRIGDWLKSMVPSTIHKLIGSAPGRAPRFGASWPLSVDLVVLDETSMVDLELMKQLLLALPEESLLWVLGDRQQLASVAVGSVLGDICRGLWDPRVRSTHPRAAAAAAAISQFCGGADSELNAHAGGSERSHPLAACLVELVKSHRFRDDTVIGQFALTLVREPDEPQRAIAALDALGDRWRRSDAPLSERADGERDALIDWLADGYEGLCRTLTGKGEELPATTGQWHLSLLKSLDDHRVLTARRGSIWGVEVLNQELQKALRARAGKARSVPPQPWVGLPVMVLRNDYELDVRNGDIGVCCIKGVDLDSALKGAWGRATHVVFAGGDGQVAGPVRYVSLAQLSAWEPALAMTVHKSQGSEFDTVTLVAAPSAAALLTRELVYTGVTRGKQHLRVLGDRRTLTEALQRTVPSGSLLGTRLWG
jgi:exodeoxyribonuclease V alpha subunit